MSSPAPLVTLGDALPHGSAVAGLGIDLCEISRIRDAITRHGSLAQLVRADASYA